MRHKDIWKGYDKQKSWGGPRYERGPASEEAYRENNVHVWSYSSIVLEKSSQVRHLVELLGVAAFEDLD